MNWDSHYTEWQAARAGRHNAEAHRIIEAARKRISEDRVHGWTWCREALRDRERKWFVAALFKYQPVPRRLFQPMLDAAVVDVDASSNRLFIEPCVETFGNVAVVGALTAMKASGRVSEQQIKMALYWAGPAGRMRAIIRKTTAG